MISDCEEVEVVQDPFLPFKLQDFSVFAIED